MTALQPACHQTQWLTLQQSCHLETKLWLQRRTQKRAVFGCPTCVRRDCCHPGESQHTRQCSSHAVRDGTELGQFEVAGKKHQMETLSWPESPSMETKNVVTQSIVSNISEDIYLLYFEIQYNLLAINGNMCSYWCWICTERFWFMPNMEAELSALTLRIEGKKRWCTKISAWMLFAVQHVLQICNVALTNEVTLEYFIWIQAWHS